MAGTRPRFTPRHVTAAVAAVAAVATLAMSRPADAAETRAYVRSLNSERAFQQYSRVVGTDRFAKFVIDVKTNDIYYFDVNLFRLHADFVLGYLLKLPWTHDNVVEYNKNYERDKPAFILGYIVHHLKVDVVTFSFWEGDKIDARTVERVHKKLNETLYLEDIAFRPDSPAQIKIAQQVARRGIEVTTNDEIYKGADYQAFNKGRAIGKLRIVPEGTPYDKLLFDRKEIVLLQEAYLDIPPVAGILSTVVSTPLAHVNLRAKAWGVPNASFKRARSEYRKLDGTTVFYEVRDMDHTLRPATEAEIEQWRAQLTAARTVYIPEANLTNANMAMLTHLRVADVTSYGAKTANLGEIASAQLPGVHVPAGFGLPFAYYVRHMRQHGLDQRVTAMLADERFGTDPAWRKQTLEELRAAIVEAPIDPDVLNAIYKRVQIKLGGAGVFVRSSTNAEDLDGFNGAGLYDTVPNVVGKRQLGEAVKKVWASLWNFRAVEERSAFGIDHTKVYAAVMVQVGVNASAAGVLITTNLYDPEDADSFTINAKWGLGIRVVEGTRIPEQIVFDTKNDGTKILSRSDDPVMLVFDPDGGTREVPNEHQGVILSEERAKRLAETVLAFVPLFGPSRPLDVEWLFEDEKVWIVQARPFIQ